MFDKIFSTIGGFLGQSFGGGILSTIGRFAGKMLGDYLDNLSYEPEENYYFKNIKDSFSFNTANYGDSIPLIFGKVKINGKIIWSAPISMTEKTYEENKYFANSDRVRSINYNSEMEYFLSFAIAICEGEILEISRIWANDKLINIGDYKYRLYLGDEEQLPDPLICSFLPKSTAYRGLAYIIFENLPLASFENLIPNFSFEVTRKPNIANIQSTEDLVKSINVIPGSGEYVYDTIVQYKIIKDKYIGEVAREVINSHNCKNISNSVHSLDQLQMICPNIKWISLVICWFGNDLNAQNCLIRPAIEFNDPNASYSEDWQVANYNRSNAMIISKDEYDNPRYGGSVNDASLVRYLKEIKRRGLKIMFNPMFFLDVAKKPWRGHLTGSVESIHDFFNKKEGYNNFILHYAHLTRDYIDAFIIGSELIGLTSIADSENNFPAIMELINLAKLVKTIIKDKPITYAADWSEYHHTKGGWYNLDPLFASPYIDFIGIDAYFPITRSLTSRITKEDIFKGMESGEGYDFYIDDKGEKQALDQAYAWKNIRFWWENKHKNPDGKFTDWQPKMKKIWFTEFGYPSIDKATNQPNIFFDPKSIDGGLPKYSTGATDFSIQRKSIRAFIEYWQEQEYVEQMFLWTWDARPYPAWPHMNIWQDGFLWEKGHWVNNKFGTASLAGMLLEISKKCQIGLNKIELIDLDESVEGIIFDKGISAFDNINILRIIYFFDIISSSDEKIIFIKRAAKNPYNINSNMLIKLSDDSYLEKISIDNKNIVSKLALYFIDHDGYKINHAYINNELLSNKNKSTIRLPIIFSRSEIERLGYLILKNALIESKVIKFVIPIINLECEPTDFVTLNYKDYQYHLRIIAIKLAGLTLEITGIFDDISSYYLPASRDKDAIIYDEPIDIKFAILDLPLILNNNSYKPHIYAYLQSNIAVNLYASISGDNQKNYFEIAKLDKFTSIGKIANCNLCKEANIFLVDLMSKFTIYCSNLENYASNNNWNQALIGKEIIRFKNCKMISKGLYEVTNLIRGEFCSENYINSQKIGDEFILLHNANLIAISENLENKEIFFTIDKINLAKNLNFENKWQKIPDPFIKYYNFQNKELELKFIPRTKNIDDWCKFINDEKYEFEIKITSNNKIHNVKTDKTDLKIKLDDFDETLKPDVKIMVKKL